MREGRLLGPLGNDADARRAAATLMAGGGG